MSDNKKREEDIYNEKCFSYVLLNLIIFCYFLSIKTTSKQMKIEKFLYKNIINNNNETTQDNNNNINNEKINDKKNNEEKQDNITKMKNYLKA